jgi:hypothetical protein
MNNMNGINNNNKNIIIQNFNCIDYNNINININSSINNINNIIKPFKYQKKRNNSNKNKNISIKKINNSLNPLINYTNFKNNKNNYNNTITKKELEKLHQIKFLCDSYIKNSQKNSTSFNNSKFFIENKNNIFKRLHNEKKLTYKENSDIKNKILNYYLHKKEGFKTFHKKKAKYIKVNENLNDIGNNNIINEESSSYKKRDIKSKITKQKTFKQIENASFSNNAFNGKKKFIRPRKEKRKTEVCSANIKKNLCEYKFIHIK